MPRIKLADLKAALDACRRENTVLLLAVSDLATGRKPDVVRVVSEKAEPRNRYRLSLFRATSRCGGIVVTVFRATGQKPSTTVQYLDDMLKMSAAVYPEIRAAVDSFDVERTRRFEVECRLEAEGRPGDPLAPIVEEP